MGGGECDYGTILSAADVVALLADHDEAPSAGTTFEAVLQQVLHNDCLEDTALHALTLYVPPPMDVPRCVGTEAGMGSSGELFRWMRS